MKTMNQADKVEYLNTILNEGEKYEFQIWGTLMADTKTYLAIGAISSITFSGGTGIGAFSNAYCYIGGTKSHLNFIVIDSIDVSKVRDKFTIPIHTIREKKVKKSFIPGRFVIKLKFNGGELKIALMNNTIGSDLKDQRIGVQKFIEN